MAEYRIRFVADTNAANRSIGDIQKAIKAVTKEFEAAQIGSDEFIESASDLSKLKQQLGDARNAVVSIDNAYKSLNKAIDANYAVATKAGQAAEAYNKKLLGLVNEQLQAEDQARRKNFQAEVDDWDKRFNLAVAQSKRIAAQQRGIMEFRAGMGARGAIPEVASPIRGGANQFGSPAYFDALDKSLKDAIDSAKDIGPKPEAFSPYSLAAYETKLRNLKEEARLIAPETARWKALTKEIIQTERAVENINKRQSAGPSTRTRLGAAGGAFLYGGGLGGGIGSALGGIAGGLAGGVPGAFAGAAVGQAIDGLTTYAAAIATTYAEVNKARIALAGVVKDQKDYDNAIAASTQISNNFLLPIDQATRQFTKLQASVAGAGFKTEETKQVFKGIASAIIATGGSAEDLNGALTATAQVFSKGKVTAEELRGQIGERLPGAFTIFAQSIGKTPQQLDEALQKGEVSLDDFLKFTQELTKRYATTAEILADAPENAGARLQVALTAASAAYGGFFQQVGAGFQDYLTDLINFTIENEKQFKTFVATLRVAAEDFYAIFSGVIDSILPLFENFFKYIFDNFARGLNALATLADESRRAAGGPEKRAAAMVDLLYQGKPLEGYFGGRRKAYEEALRVEIEYDKKESKIQKDRQSRISSYVKNWMKPVRPSQFGMGLGTEGAASLAGGGGGAGGKTPKAKEPNIYLSDASIAIKDELQRRLAAIEQNIKLTEREKQLQSARLNFFADNAIAKAELDKKLLEIEKAGYANRQDALDDANAEYTRAINEAAIKREQAFTSSILNAIESETSALAEAELRLNSYNSGLEENEELIKAELFIREQLVGVEEKELPILKAAIDAYRELVKARVATNKELAYQKKLNEEILKPLQDEIELLRTVNEEEAKRLALKQKFPSLKEEDLNRVYDLEKIRDNIKNVRELIDGFVTETSSDYKGFLKEVISGEDAVESLKKFQEGLKDRVLTIFLDFALAPVEKFFKESLANLAIDKLFPKTAVEDAAQKQQPSTTPIEAQDKNTMATDKNTEAINSLTSSLQSSASQGTNNGTTLPGVSSPLMIPGVFGGLSPSLFLPGNAAASGISYEGVTPAMDIGLGSIGTPGLSAASENLDASLSSVVDSINKNAQEASDSGKAGAKWQESLGKVTQGIGVAAGAILGIYAGISQIKEGGTGNVLSGIGSILLGVAGGIGGIAGLIPQSGKAANGAVWKGGFTAFANGGMVNGPTLGLIGEGRYNEAIVPLPNGRSIPVQFNGRSARDVMGNGNTAGSQALSIDMKFETTKINGVEYVSREQLEQAMAETRRKATRDGAAQGSQLALSKIKNSPNTRRQLGM